MHAVADVPDQGQGERDTGLNTIHATLPQRLFDRGGFVQVWYKGQFAVTGVG